MDGIPWPVSGFRYELSTDVQVPVPISGPPIAFPFGYVYAMAMSESGIFNQGLPRTDAAPSLTTTSSFGTLKTWDEISTIFALASLMAPSVALPSTKRPLL